MRHLVFVLVLALAAFAGGALMNGPGLDWVRENVIGGPTVVADSGGPAPSGRPPRRFPTASTPPLGVDLAATLTPTSAPTPATPPAPAPAPPAPDSLTAQLLPPGGLDLSAPLPGRQAALAAPPMAVPPLELPGEPTPKADPTARLVSAIEPAADALAATPTATPGGDWAGVRARLKEMGASRFTVEADLAGRVRFSCVIPVEGLRAVGHHFEAEGDDEFQAAEATLRRIALWRATEPGRPAP